MPAFAVQRPIAAPPDRVWAILTDAPALVAGGLGILKLEGTIAAGARLTVWSESAPDRGFAVRVTEFVPGHSMVWTGGLPLGLFTGVRRFTLTASGAGTVFHMRETFGGLLAPLMARVIPDLTPSFERFADGLRRLAEGATHR